MRGKRAKEWDGQQENKDNMEAFKILRSATTTNTFSVMSQDAVLGAAAPLLSCNKCKKNCNLKKKALHKPRAG